MHHLETLIQAIPPAVFAAGGSPALNPPQSEHASSPSSTMFPTFPSGIPPPSLHVFPLTNPSTHFTPEPKSDDKQQSSPSTSFQTFMGGFYNSHSAPSPEQLAEEASRLSLTASYLYFDDEGYTRWQGETSGLPLLDLLIERKTPDALSQAPTSSAPPKASASGPSASVDSEWFPNRSLRRTDVNPQILWRMITAVIPPDLMDRFCPSFLTAFTSTKLFVSSLVQCYLSTSYYILPFLHVPSFLSVRSTLSSASSNSNSSPGLRKPSEMG